jgi:ankyrin repeat protein
MDFRRAHKAIKKGDVISIRHFLQSGGDANLANRLSWTLLMMAALEGNTAIGEELIQRGAHLDMQNKFGETALSLLLRTPDMWDSSNCYSDREPLWMDTLLVLRSRAS